MRVERVAITPDAYRQSQFYAGTHLAHYDIPQQKRNIEKPNEIPFERRLQKALNGSQIVKTPSLREREFLKLREEHAKREEAFQRLTYENGVNFTVEQHLTLLKRFS